MNDFLITVSRTTEDGIEDIFSESTDFEGLHETFQHAWHEVHRSIGQFLPGTAIREGDIIASEGVVTKLIDSMTTTSGAQFILVEINDVKVAVLQADKTYEVTRTPQPKEH